MKASFKCWSESCIKFRQQNRIDFKDLIERHEDTGHYDYVCPECEAVIICSKKRIK